VHCTLAEARIPVSFQQFWIVVGITAFQAAFANKQGLMKIDFEDICLTSFIKFNYIF
jgi:hypothetical protein